MSSELLLPHAGQRACGCSGSWRYPPIPSGSTKHFSLPHRTRSLTRPARPTYPAYVFGPVRSRARAKADADRQLGPAVGRHHVWLGASGGSSGAQRPRGHERWAWCAQAQPRYTAPGQEHAPGTTPRSTAPRRGHVTLARGEGGGPGRRSPCSGAGCTEPLGRRRKATPPRARRRLGCLFGPTRNPVSSRARCGRCSFCHVRCVLS